MATRVPQQSPQGKAGLRSGSGNGRPVDDGTVFSSMKEFWLWVAIVTLILFLLFASALGFFYTQKQIKKTEAILLRAEQLEKDKKNDRRKKADDEE